MALIDMTALESLLLFCSTTPSTLGPGLPNGDTVPLVSKTTVCDCASPNSALTIVISAPPSESPRGRLVTAVAGLLNC